MATQDQEDDMIQCEVPAKKKAIECKINQNKPCDSTCERKINYKSAEEREAIAHGDFKKSSQYKALLHKMNKLYDCYKEAMYRIGNDIKTVSSDFDRTEEDIRKFRSKINSLLDLMENSIRDEIRKKKRKDTHAHVTLLTEMSHRKTELSNEISKMENFDNLFSITRFYHLLEEGEVKTDSLREQFNSLTCKISMSRVAFAMNESIIDMLKSTHLGVLKEESLGLGIVEEKQPDNRTKVQGIIVDNSKSIREKDRSTASHTDEPTFIDTSCIKQEPITVEDHCFKEQDITMMYEHTKESGAMYLTSIKEETITLEDRPIKEHGSTTVSQHKEEPMTIDLTCVKEEPIIIKKPNQDLSNVKEEQRSKGKGYPYVRIPKKFTIKKLVSLNVKHLLDKDPYLISGSVMINSHHNIDQPTSSEDSIRIALADYNNSTIRIVEMPKDPKKKTVVSHRVTLVSRPWDIACVGKTQLITTVPDIESLLCLKVGPTLTVNKRIQVDGRCRGIDCTNDALVVTFVNPGCVKILDMDGKVLKTITTDLTGTPLFQTPYYVKISSYNGLSAYVSDWGKHTVTKIDVKTGKMLDVYLSKELRRPYGVDVDVYGRVYVCGWESNNICVVSPVQQQIRPLFSVPVPFSVAVSNDEGKMYISHSSRETMDVFKLF